MSDFMVYLVPVQQFRTTNTGNIASSNLYDPESASFIRAPTNTDLELNLSDEQTLQLKIANAQLIQYVRLSTDRQFMAILRGPRTAELISVKGQLASSLSNNSYSGFQISCSLKHAKVSTELMGLHFVGPDALLLIANTGIELFQIYRSKVAAKSVKSYALPVNWYHYLPSENLFIFSSDINGHAIHVVQIQRFHQNGDLIRWPKFNIEFPGVAQPKVKLLPHHVTLCKVYGMTLMLVSNPQTVATISLYALKNTHITRLPFEIRLPESVEQYRINIVENLILISCLDLKTTYIYDLESRDPQQPIVNARPIAPLQSPVNDSYQSIPSSSSSHPAAVQEENQMDVYSADWMVSSPETVCCLKQGLTCKLLVNINQIKVDFVKNAQELCRFLMRRTDTMYLLEDSLKTMVKNRTDVREMSAVFEEIFRIQDGSRKLGMLLNNNTSINVGSKLETKLTNTLSSLSMASSLSSAHVSVSNLPALADGKIQTIGAGDISPTKNESTLPTQKDLFKTIIQPFIEAEGVDKNYLIRLLLEWHRINTRHHQPSDPLLNEALIHLLIYTKQHNYLRQLIQYQVFNDSTRLAETILLLGCGEGVFQQLGMDMLRRLGRHDLIIKNLLDHQKVIPALQYIRENSLLKTASARQFLDVAAQLHATNPHVFYNTFRFFEQRNLFLYNSSMFPPGEGCQVFEKNFETWWRRADDKESSSTDISAQNDQLSLFERINSQESVVINDDQEM